MNVQQIAKDLGLVRLYKLKHTVSLSLVNDGVKVIAKKGASIPATFTNIVRTAVDNQIKSETDILYGEFEKASANTKITTMTLEGLPIKPAGKSEVKFTLFIDIYGNLRIEKMSLDNGLKEIFNDKVNWLIEEG
jgi:molecular chaperone DnaK (HSP70)